jgi:Zn-dependent protease
MAAAAARSLEALGRADEAEAKRAEARELAPLAFWNHPVTAAPTAQPVLDIDNQVMPGDVAADAEPPAPATFEPDAPIARVASGAATAAWILAVLAALPLVGALSALPLGIVSLVLLVKRRPLAHDRRVGLAGLAISAASILCAGMVAAGFVVRLDREEQVAALLDDFAASAPASMPATSDGRPSTAPTTSSAPATASGPDEYGGFPATRIGDPESQDFDEDVWQDDDSWRDDADSEDEGFAPSLSMKILYLAVLVISIILHEIGHAVAACWSGDPTARDLGRFSLNPIRHIDPVGSVIVPVVLSLLPGGVIIGWAKPVPIRPNRFRHRRRGQLGVTLAGVSLNLLMAFAAGSLLTIMLLILDWQYPQHVVWGLTTPFELPQLMNVPAGHVWAFALEICKATIVINAILACFNLLPLPPLDGFGVLRAISPRALLPLINRATGIGMIGLLCLVAFDLLQYVLLPGLLLAVILLAAAIGLSGSML